MPSAVTACRAERLEPSDTRTVANPHFIRASLLLDRLKGCNSVTVGAAAPRNDTYSVNITGIERRWLKARKRKIHGENIHIWRQKSVRGKYAAAVRPYSYIHTQHVLGANTYERQLEGRIRAQIQAQGCGCGCVGESIVDLYARDNTETTLDYPDSLAN